MENALVNAASSSRVGRLKPPQHSAKSACADSCLPAQAGIALRRSGFNRHVNRHDCRLIVAQTRSFVYGVFPYLCAGHVPFCRKNGLEGIQSTEILANLKSSGRETLR